MSNYPQESGVSIIGGGISGLTTAWEAIKNGQNPADIHIYEASNRLGGKIQTLRVGAKLVNAGAEFIDSNSPMVKLCDELGVRLTPTGDQSDNTFQKLDGGTISNDEFFKAYTPIVEQIRADKEEVARNPNGQRAKELDKLTLKDYMQKLGEETEIRKDRSWMRVIWDAITFNSNHVSPDIIHAATQAFTSEVGRPADQIGALQFVHEASADPTRYLASDCGFRVEGGTEQIIHALKAKLEQSGVQFHMNAGIDSVRRENGKTTLAFTDPVLGDARTDKIVFALPAYALSTIKGVDEFIGAEATQALAGMQYTNSVKFFIPIKPGAKVPDTNFFSGQDFQCWPDGQGMMTFLCNADRLKTHSPKQLIDECANTYASAMGKKADDLFDHREKDGKKPNIAFINPGNKPCYGTPAPGKMIELQQLAQHLSFLPKDVGVVGTFMPGPDGQVGFMECGYGAASRVAEVMLSPEPARAQWLEQHLARSNSLPQRQQESDAAPAFSI